MKAKDLRAGNTVYVVHGFPLNGPSTYHVKDAWIDQYKILGRPFYTYWPEGQKRRLSAPWHGESASTLFRRHGNVFCGVWVNAIPMRTWEYVEGELLATERRLAVPYRSAKDLGRDRKGDACLDNYQYELSLSDSNFIPSYNTGHRSFTTFKAAKRYADQIMSGCSRYNSPDLYENTKADREWQREVDELENRMYADHDVFDDYEGPDNPDYDPVYTSAESSARPDYQYRVSSGDDGWNLSDGHGA